MTESLRTIATDAPGTFQVVSADLTYASNPGKGSFACCCAPVASGAPNATGTRTTAATTRAVLTVQSYGTRGDGMRCMPNLYTETAFHIIDSERLSRNLARPCVARQRLPYWLSARNARASV